MNGIKSLVGMALLSALFFLAGKAAAAGATGTGPLNILNKCVDVPGWQTANGTLVQIFTCNGGTNQEWELLNDGTVRPAFNPNKCLDLPGFNTTDGTLLQIYDCNGGANQQWTLGPDGSLQGYGGKCVDNPGGNTNDGTIFQYFDCNGGSNQVFSLGSPVAKSVGGSWNPNFDNGVAVTSNVAVSINSDGSFDFSASFHDSGFLDYDVNLVCPAIDTNGQAYSFTASGSVHGSESLWLGGSRDFNASQNGNSDILRAAYWLLATQQQLTGQAIQCNASASLDLNSLLNQFGAALGVAGTVIGIASLHPG